MRCLAIVCVLAGVVQAAAPEPKGPHPRMLLTPELRSTWQAQAKAAHGPVVGAIALCKDAHDTQEHDHAVYQGSEWAKVLQACLVAWAATDDKQHAQTAQRFFTALIDDLEVIGDHRGGDEAARRDDGYAIRNLGPYTALAYDWLHDQLPADLRARARSRWKAWLAWYRDKGYRAHNPGSNYHAGYLLAATTIAIAQAGEGDSALWREVADTMWGKEMAAALADGAVLDGGDWPEGWQYGPLATAEYALGARIARAAGIEVPNVSRWLGAVLKHHVYALSPNDALYAGGDLEDEIPNAKPSVLELDAIALGDASPDDKRWALGELVRLKLIDGDWLLYDALAAVGGKPIEPPRDRWPLWYLAEGTGTLFTRTRWDDRAIWFVTACHAAIETDHRHPDAGNFVLSRGKDDVIVDPSPYGTQTTLTSNAPTVASGQLPKDYIPSQAFWGKNTGWEHTTVRASGVVAARCDYSDQYKFQDRRSDVPDAERDLVLLPSKDGRDAALVVVDRASTGGEDRALYLRFRSPGHFALEGTTGTATIGGSKLAIQSLLPARPQIGVPSAKDCFKEGTVRGTCDAARFPVTDYRVVLDGPHASAAHVISATDAAAPPVKADALSGDGWQGVHVRGPRDAVVVWRLKPGKDGFSYTSPASATTHVVLDTPAPKVAIAAHLDGDHCAVEIRPAGDVPARPLVFATDAQCNISSDPEGGAAPTPVKSATATDPRSPRAGCCGAQTTPGSPISMTVIVGAWLWFTKRKERRAVVK